jgi:photosystem II stability/assembly factor-like uncharacterized protein
MRRDRLFPLLLVLALITLPALAGDRRWTILGPFGGNVLKLAFNPGDPGIAYAASDNGMFRSTDSGQSWQPAAALLGTPMLDVGVSAADANRVYASSSYGLYRSTDRGVTWTRAHNLASYKVGVSPQNADIVYSLSSGGPFRSSDGGMTFGSVGSGLPALTNVTAFAVDPHNPDVVYVSAGSSAGVFKTVDGGTHWSSASFGLSGPFFFTLVADPVTSGTLYVGAGGGNLYKTIDGGAGWSPLNTGQTNVLYQSLAISAAAPSTIVAATNAGVIRSTDSGMTWSAPQLRDNGGAAAIAVDPANPARILAESAYTLFRSADGNLTWAQSAAGLTAHVTQSIAVDPRDDAVVYACGPTGFSRSVDRGNLWTTIGPTCSSVAVDSSGTLYLLSSGIVRRSVDNGATWTNFNAGIAPAFAGSLAADPKTAGVLYVTIGGDVYRKSGEGPWTLRSTGLSSSNFLTYLTIDPLTPSTLYAGGSEGLFKSSNAGVNWAPATGGLGGLIPTGLAVDPFDSNHLLTWAATGVLESGDGGSNWITLGTGPHTGNTTLTFDPAVRGRIYANSFGEVQIVTNHGQTWTPFSTGFGPLHGQLFAVSATGSTLYAGGSTSGVWVYHYGRARAVRH